MLHSDPFAHVALIFESMAAPTEADTITQLCDARLSFNTSPPIGGPRGLKIHLVGKPLFYLFAKILKVKCAQSVRMSPLHHSPSLAIELIFRRNFLGTQPFSSRRSFRYLRNDECDERDHVR